MTTMPVSNPHHPDVRLEPAWLDAHWMPFTANRKFKADPRMFVAAKGAYYTDVDGRKIFDGLSGLWCTGLGHARPEIVEAVSRQIAKLDYVFFTGSGSEAADTSLKMARAYWRAKGQAGKTRLIGREKAYHGVNFGGISVGGLAPNRKLFGQGIEADFLPHTHLAENAFTRGQPQRGAELADRLLDLIALHDASTIAAVIVEPFSGSAGVLVPPAGYLQRLRDICTAHDILLIFDEVITGFGRVGATMAAEAFGVVPDIMNVAKQVTNGTQPLGAVIASKAIYETFMQAGGPDYMLEFPHGYTYSAHPVACAAAIATLDVLRNEDMAGRVSALAPVFEEAVHSLKGSLHVLDIRNYGLAAGFSIAHAPGEPARRPYEIAQRCWEKGFYVRYGSDTIQLAPPFIAEPREIDDLVNALGEALRQTD